VAVDRNLILKELILRLNTASVTSLIGSPARIYSRPPENAVFPWVRMNMIPASYLTGTLGFNVKPNWIRQMTIQFLVYALDTSVAAVSAIQKAIADVLDKFPALASIPNCKIGQCLPGPEHADYAPDIRSAFSVQDYTLSFEDTSSGIVPATVDFFVTKDTRIASSSPTGNFDYFYLRVGREGGNFSRSLLHFDVSSIPLAAVVSSASLYLTSILELTPTQASKVKRLTTTTWIQTLATWNTSDGATAWSPPNATSPQTGPYTETDAVAVSLPAGSSLGNYIPFTITGLAALVQDAIANRSGQLHVMLLANTESIPATISAEFVDSETSVDLIAGGGVDADALPPKLTVSYTA
jgi:hypothetical protein